MNSMKRQKDRTLKDELPTVHCRFITNHPRLETTPMLINNVLQKDLEFAPGRSMLASYLIRHTFRASLWEERRSTDFG